MKKLLASLMLVSMLALSGNAFGYVTNVIDLNTTDANVITSQSGNGDVHTVNESYGDYTRIVPYPSHDGYALQNSQGEYFAKSVTVSSQDRVSLVFNVTNATPYTWSDYHFVLGAGVSLASWTSDVFTNSALQGQELSFWAPNWVSNGQTVSFTLQLDPVSAGTFNITQVATTVPIPGGVWLLGSGLVGLVGYARKFRL